MFGFTIWPVTRSRMRSSKSAKFSDPFFNAVLEGVDHKLQELGYHIAYINTGAQVITTEQARTLLQSSTASGMVASASNPAEVLRYSSCTRSNTSMASNRSAPVGDCSTVGSPRKPLTFGR